MKTYTPIDDPDPLDGIWKRIVVWLVIWIILPAIFFSYRYYNNLQKHAREYVPEEKYHVIRDPERSNAEIRDIVMRGDTLEYIYEGDPRIIHKQRVKEPDIDSDYDVDLSDPVVVERIFETTDFWELYERYAD